MVMHIHFCHVIRKRADKCIRTEQDYYD